MSKAKMVKMVIADHEAAEYQEMADRGRADEWLLSKCASLQAEKGRLSTRVVVLEKALRPFADVVDEVDNNEGFDGKWPECFPTERDCRYALAVLNGGEKERVEQETWEKAAQICDAAIQDEDSEGGSFNQGYDEACLYLAERFRQAGKE